jgi:RimJ/RimL family protein N-acetyltransferase
MGYAKPAYKQFMKYLFEYLDLNKVALEVLSTNIVAINLYTSLGFVHEGIKRQEVLKNGEWVDSIIMSTLKSEFYEDWN